MEEKMNIPELRSVHWISPPDMGGENVSSVMRRYVERLGWNTKSENPAIIFCGSESQLERAAEAKEKYGVPVAMNFWGWMPERFRLLEWRVHYQKRIELIHKVADIIVVPAKSAFQQLCCFGINKMSYIIPPGADIELAHSVRSKQEFKYVVSVGRLVSHKRFNLVIEALSKISGRIPYIVVGTGPLREELLKQARECNVQLIIEENASDETKFSLIRNAVCLVAPSEYEGFDMPIIEAAVSGTPVLASNLPIHFELFDDYPIYFPDAEDLASLIYQLSTNIEFRKIAAARISFLGTQYSAIVAAAAFSRVLCEMVATWIKNKLWKEYEVAKISTEELYNIEAKIDTALFPYRLDPTIADFSHRTNFLLNHLTGTKILDAACSNGVFSVHMAANGFDVTAMDISDEYLNNAKKLSVKMGLQDKIKFEKADLEQLYLPDCHFDCVWAGEIIEHFANPNLLLFQLIRVLKPSGRLIFTVPYGDACYDPMHQKIFNTEDDIRNMFAEFKDFKLDLIEHTLGSSKNWLGYGTKL